MRSKNEGQKEELYWTEKSGEQEEGSKGRALLDGKEWGARRRVKRKSSIGRKRVGSKKKGQKKASY
ncbi:hypothetical protein BTS2_2044 [Bacillus sp. TS-2]|nr:hypothetical protein BTS2_2044 [Bacillus sp. TS-2]